MITKAEIKEALRRTGQTIPSAAALKRIASYLRYHYGCIPDDGAVRLAKRDTRKGRETS